MRAAGIICEYNPFHLGHAKQLRMVREALGGDTALVCLMSGNFVQRGAPAIFDKTVRARAAVACGADLVLELPVCCALQSAEGFARSGVGIFDRLGAVDVLAFGSETGQTETLLRTAQTMLLPEFSALLRAQLETGASYPAARQRALERLKGDGALLAQPNDILAVEYCKALLERESAIRPLALHRAGDYHDQKPDAEDPSATAVRTQLMEDGDWRRLVPKRAAEIYAGATRYAQAYGERAMLARLRGMDKAQWEQVPFGSEGLWSKVWKAVQTQASIEETLCAAKSRRYPRTRLQRMLMCAYLGLTQEQMLRPAPYVRALAFDDAGRALLRRMRREGSIPIVNAGERPENADFFALECRCAALYGLFAQPGARTNEVLEEKLRFHPEGKK